MGIQFKKSVLEMLILSLINNEEYTGFQIEKLISSSIKIPEGSIYPMLRKLCNEDYIISFYKLDEHNQSKKLYKLSAKGLNYHDQLQSEWNDLTNRINILMKEDHQ